MRPTACFVGYRELSLTVSVTGIRAVQAAEQKQVVNQKQTTNQKQDQRQEQWRYTFHNGEWWYWLPTSRWVYWRDTRWNAYDARTYTYPAGNGVIVAGRDGGIYRSSVANTQDNRPFYGHALSDLDRRSLETNNEVGPFYGHALPNEVFGGWRARRSNRPFYGHAVSSGD